MAEAPPNVDGLNPELKSYVVQVLEENARLKAENIALREENARLKGLKGRPKLKPSGMEKSTEARAKGKRKPGRRWIDVEPSAPSSPSTRPRSSRKGPSRGACHRQLSRDHGGFETIWELYHCVMIRIRDRSWHTSALLLISMDCSASILPESDVDLSFQTQWSANDPQQTCSLSTCRFLCVLLGRGLRRP